VDRRYGKKEMALWPDMGEQNSYWKPYKWNYDPVKNRKNRESSRQRKNLEKEKSDLVVELFGVDVEKQRLKEEGLDPDLMAWNGWDTLSYLPEAKREAVQLYLDGFQDKEQEFFKSTRLGWNSADRVRQKQLEQEKLAGLAQLLTPQELREYELRSSQSASQVQMELRSVAVSREQYEALYDIQVKYGDSIYNWVDANNDSDTIKRITQNKKDMDAEILTALGPDTGQEFVRGQDYNYQQLGSLAQHYDLPADAAGKVYDFKEASQKAVDQVRGNIDLTPEDRQTALAQIRAETEQSVRTTLGDKVFKKYMNSGGWWLNTIAPAAAPVGN
jgi:hypothetical protein